VASPYKVTPANLEQIDFHATPANSVVFSRRAVTHSLPYKVKGTHIMIALNE
jgi:hypothetical protein